MKWTELEPATEQAIGLVNVWTADIDKSTAFINTYIDKFRAGMAVFYPWYQDRMKHWRIGNPIFPPFPHEVFPDLFHESHGEASKQFYAEWREFEEKENES